MNKCRKANKLICVGMAVMAAVLSVSCGGEERKDIYRMELNQDVLSDSETESEQDAAGDSATVLSDASQAESGGEGAETQQQFSYFINWEGHWNYPSIIYHIGEVELQPYFVPVLLVEIPDDRQKEERINRMLLEHYVEVLPDAEEEEWWRMQEIRITYRSERYFCFRYVSNTALPEGCNYNDLYITLDLEQERILPYPATKHEGKKYSPQDWGELYKEMELYQEKTVAEQSALRGEQSYKVQAVTAECDGIVFPCVGIDGMSDGEKQERINSILQEPIRTCIMNEGWDSDSEKQKLFDKVKIYIAYQSEEWLSVVYSVTVDLPYKSSDGVADFGVTVDLQNGERVMLGDLFEIDDLMAWIYISGRYAENSASQRELGFLLTEEEVLSYILGESLTRGWFFVERYTEQFNTFYLYEGQLVILQVMGSFDIPLPEICEYLKVDPWY